MPENLVQDLERIQGERKNASVYLSEHDTRVQLWNGHEQRLRDLDAFLRGDWHVVFPDESAIIERPKVANIAALALNDYARLCAEIRPSLRCEPAKENGKARASKRERIASAYLKANHWSDELRARYFMDLLGAGVSYKLVLPGDGFPRIRRMDPRHAYPAHTYHPDRPYRDMLFAYELPAGELGLDTLKPQELVKLIEFYDSSEWVRVASYSEGSKRRGIVLERASNLIGKVNVVVAALPSFDGQFRGMFDDALGPLQQENRLQNLLLDMAAEMIGASKIMYGIHNGETVGPGSQHHVDDPNAYIKSAELQHVEPTVFATMAQLKGDSRVAAVYPEARSGSVTQNIISAAGLESLVGNLGSAVAQAQKIEGHAWARALELAFEIDEVYLDEKKFIAGSVANQRFSESYTPSIDIKGDYTIDVDYPIAGVDQFGAEIRLNAAVNNGIISLRKAREHSSLVGDVLETEREIEREKLKEMAFQWAAQQAMAGNNEPIKVWYETLNGKQGEDPLMAIAQLAGWPTSAAGAQQSPTPEDPFTVAASQARGGIPNQNTTVPGQTNPLPPLSSVLAG